MKSVAADLGIGEDSPPWIAFARDAFPRKPGFFCVIPPNGGEEEAQLFAVVSFGTPEILPVFQEGARPAAREVFAARIDPVDSEAVARLFERGGHPGDLLIEGGGLDQYGRPDTAVLTFLDLSHGLTSSDRLCMPEALRSALAKACDEIPGQPWKVAADTLDPCRLMRDGVLTPLGGSPTTAQGFHEHMLEQQARMNGRMNVSSHPQRDFRLLEPEAVAAELEGNARAILYALGDGCGDHPVVALLTTSVPRLAYEIRTAGKVAEAAAELQSALKAVAEGRRIPVLDDMMAGVGPGAVCWRDVFSETGLIETQMRRQRDPGCDDSMLASISGMDPDIQEAFRDPDRVLKSRPRKIEHVPPRLRRRPDHWFAVAPTRMAAAPGMRTALSKLSDERLLNLMHGNETLISAFQSIENSHPSVAEAHDALAVGWRLIARTLSDRGVVNGEEIGCRAPEFLSAKVAALPWMSAIEAGAKLVDWMRQGPE